MRSASSVVQLQPVVQHGGFVLRVLVVLDLLQPGGDVGLVHLVEVGEGAFLAAVFFLQFGEAGGDAFQFGGELVDRRLLLGEVAGDDEGLGDQVAGPALVLLLALLVLLDDAGRSRPSSRRRRSGSSRPASSRPSSPSGADRRRRGR